MMNQNDLLQQAKLGHPDAIDLLTKLYLNPQGIAANDRSLVIAALTNLFLHAGRLTAKDGSLAIAALTDLHLNAKGNNAPDQSLMSPDAPAQAALKPPAAHLELIDAVAPTYPRLAQKLAAATNADLPRPDRDAPQTTTPAAVETSPIAGMNRLERLMLFTGCASAVPALAIGLASQGWFTRGVHSIGPNVAAPLPDTTATTTSGSAANLNPMDVQFAEYMLRALSLIDRTAAATPKVALANSEDTLTNLVTRTELNGKLTNVVTRTELSDALNNVVTRTELNQFMQQLLAILEQRAAGSSPLAANSAAVSNRDRAAAVQSVPSSNVPKHRISGIVEWGKKSVITIEYNGATQRVYLGGRVGSTGWTLVEVKGGQATLSKNGQFRTLADGEFL
jgi:hypothetical protein